MGLPLHLEVINAPATSAVIALCVGVWAMIQKRGGGYEHVGVSYETGVAGREYWRWVTAALSHVSILHLIFNMSALWSMRVVERGAGGSLAYLRLSLLIGVASMGIYALTYHVLIQPPWPLSRWLAGNERLRRVTAVGYSGVVFGWMAATALQRPTGGYFDFLGLFQLPAHLAPFGSLLLTQVLIPQASFVGHLSGIVVGYAVAAGAFKWFDNFWAACLLAWVAGGALISYKRTQGASSPYMSWLQVDRAADVEGGAGAGGALPWWQKLTRVGPRIQEGVVVR